jgi:hypothetical protein
MFDGIITLRRLPGLRETPGAVCWQPPTAGDELRHESGERADAVVAKGLVVEKLILRGRVRIPARVPTDRHQGSGWLVCRTLRQLLIIHASDLLVLPKI